MVASHHPTGTVSLHCLPKAEPGINRSGQRDNRPSACAVAGQTVRQSVRFRSGGPHTKTRCSQPRAAPVACCGSRSRSYSVASTEGSALLLPGYCADPKRCMVHPSAALPVEWPRLGRCTSVAVAPPTALRPIPRVGLLPPPTGPPDANSAPLGRRGWDRGANRPYAARKRHCRKSIAGMDWISETPSRLVAARRPRLAGGRRCRGRRVAPGRCDVPPRVNHSCG